MSRLSFAWQCGEVISSALQESDKSSSRVEALSCTSPILRYFKIAGNFRSVSGDACSHPCGRVSASDASFVGTAPIFCLGELPLGQSIRHTNLVTSQELGCSFSRRRHCSEPLVSGLHGLSRVLSETSSTPTILSSSTTSLLDSQCRSPKKTSVKVRLRQKRPLPCHLLS